MNTILKEKIVHKSAWIGQDMATRDDWIYHLSDLAKQTFQHCIDQLNARNLHAPHFSQADVVIDQHDVLAEIAQWADELENGYGFLLLRGLDTHTYSEQQLTDIYYLIGLYLGQPVTQNPRGDLLGKVENVADRQNKNTRVYQTNAYLPYHTDLSDVVGLLSIRKAKQGGLSSLVSAVSVYNQILAHHPEHLAYYYHPTYCDHLGDDEPTLTPIFSFWQDKLSCRYLRDYIELGHERKNIPLSHVQIEAFDIMDRYIHQADLRLDMMLEPGDIQFCNNYVVMHSRNAFLDSEHPEQRRKLLRLWLKVPNARTLSPDFPGRNGIAQTQFH
ncbi:MULTISPECIES: TauD/TfdA family dioxygenase [unclassified Acinetobacter]|uniref:TauD/TfdA family dioxygenase n=1 Tax=unclassified Acinetobacter TaxID=196816 RepID=UPI0029351AC7|nr:MULTISPECIES: TauD/TfdA family dioxygenase [unclassified Acinetobacter]WOE32606.1 TauD/TfdA family dioxygenase [Acinetobacter sp. SAAs470]WOE38082.1 TauD/TfdA family dioxygenase [Acinetobacter sp. SAAs474]